MAGIINELNDQTATTTTKQKQYYLRVMNRQGVSPPSE